MTPARLAMPGIRTVYGVDFSGGQAAAANTWIAELCRRRSGLALRTLEPLSSFVGVVADRAAALSGLVALVAASRDTLWGIDFPFGLPIELAAMGSRWRDQLEFVRRWPGGAQSFGRWCVDEALKLGDSMHIRRLTDTETRTPFDCYHYRIVYQTFHGMRDVLAPLADRPRTAVLPFQYRKLFAAERVIVESCPSSVLKRLNLPHQNYKQPTARRIEPSKRRTRRAILVGLEALVDVGTRERRVMMENPGGDALDAVIAGVGAWQRFGAVDHAAIRGHARYPREGFVF